MDVIGRMLAVAISASLFSAAPASARGDLFNFNFESSLCKFALGKHLILPMDLTKIRDFATSRSLIIEIIAPNSHSLPYVGTKGVKPKPEGLKRCKSAPTTSPIAGLVHCPPSLFKSPQDWLDHKIELKTQGFDVSGPDFDYLVLEAGKAFHADYDLELLRDAKGARAYSENLRLDLNELLGRRMFRHGPREDYEFKDQIGLKFPIIAFLPDGKVLTLQTPEEYQAHQKRLGFP